MKNNDLQKDNHIRCAYTILCIVILIAFLIAANWILPNPKYLNTYSYIGTAITIIGLIIAVFEIIHSLVTTKAIQKQAQEKLDGFRMVDGNTQLIECIDTLDKVNDSISNDEYFTALKYFQFYRRFYRRIHSNYNMKNLKLSTNDKRFDLIESRLHDGRNASSLYPLTKRQKKAITIKVLEIKSLLEQSIKTEGEENATS